MKARRLISLLLALTLILSLVACGNTAETDEAESSASEKKTYSLNLTEQVSSWSTGEQNGISYRYAEGVVYCTNPTTKSKQCLNIYVPAAYMNEDGSLNPGAAAGEYTCETAPILYINSVGAYLGKVPYKITDTTTIEGTSGWYYDYLAQGCVLVFAGARGRSDYDNSNDNLSLGKAPIGLADLKAGIRFVRANSTVLPGDTDRIVSSGMSAGGAMSILIAVSGNSDAFDSYLQEMGAAMDQKDDVYAAQVYCPITDLEHADLAYEWFYSADTGYDSQMSEFQSALSEALAEDYVSYFNSLELTVDDVLYQIDEGKKTGTFVSYLLDKYKESKEIYVEDGGTVTAGESNALNSIDAIVKTLKGRSKTCPSFDALELTTQGANAENYVFGSRSSTLTSDNWARHFSQAVTEAIASLKESYPEEYAAYYEAYLTDSYDAETIEQVSLYNPYTYLTAGTTDVAQKIRICVGTQDSDTSPIISACLALTLQSLGVNTEYNLIWGIGHDTADREGAFIEWVNETVMQ